MSYKYITTSISGGDLTTPRVIEGAGPGTRISAWTLVVLPAGYLDAALLSRVSICIGGNDKAPLRLRDGMSWAAPRNADGRTFAETGGLFLKGDNTLANINGFEFFVEFEEVS